MANERQRGNDIGLSGVEVGRNVARLRSLRGMSLKALEAKLGELDRKISWSSISKLENGTRKVDADDLMALAVALDVSPLSLLLPNTPGPFDQVEATGLTTTAADLWTWAVARSPLHIRNDVEHFDTILGQFRWAAAPWWLAQELTNPAREPNGNE